MDTSFREELDNRKCAGIDYLSRGYALDYTAGQIGISFSKLVNWLKNDQAFQEKLKEQCLETNLNLADAPKIVARIVGPTEERKPSMTTLLLICLFFGGGFGAMAQKYVANRDINFLTIFGDIIPITLFFMVFIAIQHTLRNMVKPGPSNLSTNVPWFLKVFEGLILGIVGGIVVGIILAVNVGVIAIKSSMDDQIVGPGGGLIIGIIIFGILIGIWRTRWGEKIYQDFEGTIGEFFGWVELTYFNR